MSHWYGWHGPWAPETRSFTAEGPGARALLRDWLKAQECEELRSAQARIRQLEAEIAALRAEQEAPHT